MRRPRVLAVCLLGVLAVLAGPLAAPALAGGLFGAGTSSHACPCPTFGSWPGFGTFPGFGPWPGFGPSPSFGTPSTFGAAPAVPAAAPTERVRLAIRDNFFLPDQLTVPVGTQVAWQNEGREPHTVTFPGVRDSGTIAPGGRWAAIFAIAGTLDYMCTIHPEMRGRLVVTSQ
jgi:plastocyanin